MTDGSEVYDEIESKVSEAERKQEKLDGTVYDCETQITRLTERREDIFERLVTLVYLPSLDAQSISQTLKEAQADVRRIFAKKQEARKQLEGGMQEAAGKKKGLESQLKEVTAGLEGAAKERERLAGVTAKALQEDARYNQIGVEAVEKRKQLDADAKRVKELEAEAKEKLPAFRQNKLFNYLLEREFGTDEYVSGGIIKALDSWVANIIHYAEQKKNYDRLKNLPQQAAEEVKKRAEACSKLIAEAQKLEQKAAEDSGLTKLLKDGEKLAGQRKELLDQIEETRKEYSQYEQQRKTLDSEKDDYHRQAIQKLKGYLKGVDVAELKKEARKTPGTEDDKLAEELEQIDADVRNYKDRAKEAKAERDKFAGKLEELRDIKTRFSRKDYEASNSRFDSSFDIGSFLAGVLAGRYSADEVFGKIDEAQSFERPRHTYSSSYSSRRSDDDDHDDDDSSSLSSTIGSILSSSSRSSSSSWGGFSGGGSSHSIGGFSGGGGSHSIGGF